jgi:1-deoxy-D-xylulose-5-phosphate synthase
MLNTAIEHNGPAAVRYPRDYGYGVPENGALRRLEIGRGEVLREGRDVLIVAVGSMVLPSLGAADVLDGEGISAAVVNARFIKPLDEDLITGAAKSVELVVTVEENSVKGGFGSAVVRSMAEAGVSTPVRVIGIPDEFVEHAPRAELLKDLGLSAEGIAGAVRAAMGRSAKKARGA